MPLLDSLGFFLLQKMGLSDQTAEGRDTAFKGSESNSALDVGSQAGWGL